MPETFRDDNTTKISQSNMKYPKVRHRNTNTPRQPTDVAKNTSKEKLSTIGVIYPYRFVVYNEVVHCVDQPGHSYPDIDIH